MTTQHPPDGKRPWQTPTTTTTGRAPSTTETSAEGSSPVSTLTNADISCIVTEVVRNLQPPNDGSEDTSTETPQQAQEDPSNTRSPDDQGLGILNSYTHATQ